MYLGQQNIGKVLTFYRQTENRSTRAAVDADSAPTYRVYEDETGTAILTGTMALLDSTNTDGFYSEQITLSTANGFEKGKSYGIRIADTVASVTGAVVYAFDMVPAGGPIEHTPVPAARILQVKDRGDGTFGVVGDINMTAGETLWWAVNLAGTQLSAGDLVNSTLAPTISGDESANLTISDYGVFGTLVKFKCVLSGSALSTDDITVNLEITPDGDEALKVAVDVVVGG